MTIRKGEPWGAAAPRPADLVLAADDAALAQLVADDAAGAYGVRESDPGFGRARAPQRWTRRPQRLAGRP